MATSMAHDMPMDSITRAPRPWQGPTRPGTVETWCEGQ